MALATKAQALHREWQEIERASMKSLERLQSHLSNRPQELQQFKDKGGKVVAYFPGGYVPEELIYASGAVPICLCHGGDPRPVASALSVTSRFLCPFSRALVGGELLGELPYYKLADLLVAPVTCQHLRRAADLLQYHSGGEVFRLGVPLEYDHESSLDYYLSRLKALKDRLEGLTGLTISDRKLEESIELYNTLRGLLRRISLLRRGSPPPISALDFVKLNHASFFADPLFMVDTLSSLARDLELAATQQEARDGPRLLLTGPNLAYGDYKVLEIAQELGAHIVVEEFCEGIWYYWGDVQRNASLLEDLARKYLVERLPCAFMVHSTARRHDFILNLAKDFSVSGIIWYELLFCETYNVEAFAFARRMEGAGLPVLKLRSDYDALDRGPLRTRIEAFLETLTGGDDHDR